MLKRINFLIFFKCCTASTTATGITLALDSVFSRSAWHIRVCRPTNLCSGRTPFSVRISKGTVFTFSTVNIKQVQVVCHFIIKRKNIETNDRTKPWLKIVAFMVVLCANIFQCVCFQRTVKDDAAPFTFNINLTTSDVYCMFCRNYVYSTNK